MQHLSCKVLVISLVFLIIVTPGPARSSEQNSAANLPAVQSRRVSDTVRVSNEKPLANPAVNRLTQEIEPRPTWIPLELHPLPPPRFGFSATLNPINEVAILFGGTISTTGEANDTWLTDGFGWIQIETPHAPEQRVHANMTYDEIRQEAVLFGGMDQQILLGDTWTFNGTDWELRNPTLSPQARVGACMAYDADRNVVILFGGIGDTGGEFWEELGDMWIWNGIDWEQQFPAHLPPVRAGASMVFDRANHRLVLFGGAVGGGILDDTWSWDGSDWTEQHPAHHPPSRYEFGMAYDKWRQVVIIWGETYPIGFADTWAWDGIDWQIVQTFQEPPENLWYMARLVYLPQRQEVIIFNDHRIKEYDDGGNIIYTEHMESWALTYQYLNYMPVILAEP